MSLTVSVLVDIPASVRSGKPSSGEAKITLDDLSRLTPEERDTLAICVADGKTAREFVCRSHSGLIDTGGTLTVLEPTLDGLVAAACDSRLKANLAQADWIIERAKKIADIEARQFAAMAGNLIEEYSDYGVAAAMRDGKVVTEISYSAKDDVKLKRPACQTDDTAVTASDDWKGWLAAIKSGNDLVASIQRSDAIAACVAAEDARYAAEQKKIQDTLDLKLWAREHGSDLTKARIEEGFDCWFTSATEDREQIVAAAANVAVMDIKALVITLPDADNEFSGEEPTDTEPLRCPTLEQIEALRSARKATEKSNAAIGLVRAFFNDEDKPTEIGLLVKVWHKFGEAERFIPLSNIED